MQPEPSVSSLKLVEYDAFRRRLWIRGQRCHHGATGSVVAAVALLAGGRSKLFLALTGGALMVHDWKDHAFWFERGRGTQP